MSKRTVSVPGRWTDLDRFRIAAEYAPIHIVFTDPDGVIQYANPAAEKITGYSRKEMVGKRPSLWGGLMPPAFYQALWKTIKKQHRVFRGEIRNRRKDGSLYIADATITPVLEGQKLIGFIGVERDITNEKKLFDGLTESTHRYRMAMRAIGGVVWEWDVKTNKIQLSEGIETMFGYGPRARFVDFSWWSKRVHADDRPRIEASIEEALKAKKEHWEAEYRFKSGKGVYVPVRDHGVAEYDTRGKPVRIVGMFQDISNERELAEKTADLDYLKNKFIQVVSHQFRTPLNAIRWNLDALADEQIGTLTEAQRAFTQLIRDMDVEVIERTDDLLTAIDIEEGRAKIDREENSLDDVIQVVTAELKPQCDSREISCRYTPAPGRIPLRFDYEKVRTVLKKIMQNAIVYTPKKGRIIVRVKKVPKAVRVEVADTGVGIPSSEQKKIFQRFFRATNATAMNTDASGLSLFIAKHFVESHDGRIGFSSTYKKGSTFWFELPT